MVLGTPVRLLTFIHKLANCHLKFESRFKYQTNVTTAAAAHVPRWHQHHIRCHLPPTYLALATCGYAKITITIAIVVESSGNRCSGQDMFLHL
ncbi:hypothetical protein ACLKA6_015680 [Drosophila palustris]